MTLAELEAQVVLREAEGRDRMILVVDRDREPRGRCVRVLPGVLGTMIGFCGGTITVDVAIADLRRYLDRVEGRP